MQFAARYARNAFYRIGIDPVHHFYSFIQLFFSSSRSIRFCYIYVCASFEVFCSVRETSRRRHAVLQRGRCIFVRSRFIRSVCIVMYEGCISREKIAYVIFEISTMKIRIYIVNVIRKQKYIWFYSYIYLAFLKTIA